MEFKFGDGAQFIVSDVYYFIIKIVEMLQNDINPIEGFVIK